MDLVGDDVDTLHLEIEHLVGYLVGNGVDTLHEERIHLGHLAFRDRIFRGCLVGVVKFNRHCSIFVLFDN
jgi:hypothetical protein